MPPRKRKAPANSVESASKKVRLKENTTTTKPEDPLPSRPKRKSVGTPVYKLTRPRKSALTQTDNGVSKTTQNPVAEPEPRKGRGRPPTQTESGSTARAPLKRGRPAKTATVITPAKKIRIETVDTASARKKRGRPSKANAAKPAKSDPPKKASVAKKAAPGKGTPNPRKRGRPPKIVSTKIPTSLMKPLSEKISDADDLLDEDNDDDQGEHQYWLMKAEPLDRFEKGHNVKFSIDDLAAAQAPEPWDGVRNYVARNNMRAMRKGDLAFFYHSNCPVPGIVGVMRIVQEHSPDQSAFNPNHPYYDPKSSPSNPKWDCVHVEFVKKFDMQITLKMMQENKNKSGELSNMSLLRLGRLSVSNVAPAEWRFILGMANEDLKVGENERIAVQRDGYEADTDGEVDGGPKEELNGDIAAGNVDAEMAKREGQETVASIDKTGTLDEY